MATYVESEGNDKTTLIKDSKEEEEKEKDKPSGLSVEEYKRLHNIGSRLSTENVITYKESAFLHSLSSDSVYHSVTGSRSPEKINDSTNALNSTDQLFDYVKPGNSSDRFKASASKSPKKADKNVKTESDKESSGKKTKKEKVRRQESVEKNERKSPKKEISPQKAGKTSPKHRKRKNSEPTPMPGRRVRREASLNAMAMVNILFEKEPPAPKSPKKRRSSQTDLPVEEKESPSLPKVVKKAKNVERKIAKKLQKNKNLTSLKSLKSEKEKDSKKLLKAKSSLLNKKMLKLKAKKKLEKAKKTMKTKNESEKNSLDPSKPRKKRTDTKKSARTDEIVIPKRKRCCSGSTCATCYQPLSCQHQSSIYWNSKDLPHSDSIPRSNSNSDSAEDVKPCINMDMTTSGYSLSHLQHIDSATYVNSMVQHPAISSHRCPQCAQAAGLMPSCQTYALSGMGSLSSMNLSAVMPYPPAYGGSYPLPYPGTSTLPHCTCPQCLYYSQPNTNISHQPLPARDHCILSHPPISIQHIEDKHVEDPDAKVVDEIIDVGVEEFPVVPQSEIIKTNKAEKIRKKSSDSQVTKIKSKSASGKDVAKPKKKSSKSEVQKRSSTESKVKSPTATKERKKSTSSKKETKIPRTIFVHGWNLHGPMENKKIYSYSLGISFEAQCFQAIKHSDDGDIIQVRDCVILRSGPKKTDIPFVAKVTQFWKHPQDGDMMMSLLWYYHPEHTEGGRKSQHATCELFASKHRDENSVACIDDKGYVLTYNEYCRFRAERLRKEADQLPRSKVVPAVEYLRSSRLPADDADTSVVFLCRQVYDFKLKRILKNPS